MDYRHVFVELMDGLLATHRWMGGFSGSWWGRRRFSGKIQENTLVVLWVALTRVSYLLHRFLECLSFFWGRKTDLYRISVFFVG